MNTNTDLTKCPICGHEHTEIIEDTLGEQPFFIEWKDDHVFKNRRLSKCQKCESVFVPEFLSNEDLSSFYADIYKNYHAPKHSPHDIFHSKYHPRYLSQANAINKSINLEDGMRCLEIGANVTSISPALSNFVKHDFFYYDQYDSDIIANYGGERLGEYFTSDSTINDIDLIVSSHVFEHINPSELQGTIEAITKSLKPGGHVFIEVPNDVDRGIFDAPHTLFYSIKGLSDLFENKGLEMVMCHKSPVIKTKNIPGSGSNNNSKKLSTRLKEILFNIFLPILGNNNIFIRNYSKIRLNKFISNHNCLYDGRSYLRVIFKKPL
jgi:SAM-dependent methyltransferase